jgi:hypothetical protein
MTSTIRHNVFKIPLNDEEDSLLRKLCNAKGMQRAPFVRALINKATTAHVRRREGRREWPVRGHVGGAARPLRV